MKETRAFAKIFTRKYFFSCCIYFVSYSSSFSSAVPILMLPGKYCTSRNISDLVYIWFQKRNDSQKVRKLRVYSSKYIYTKSTTVSVPSSELGPPNPSPASECVSPLGTKGGGHTRLRVRGWGAQIGRLEKRPSTLSTLWCTVCTLYNVDCIKYITSTPTTGCSRQYITTSDTV